MARAQARGTAAKGKTRISKDIGKGPPPKSLLEVASLLRAMDSKKKKISKICSEGCSPKGTLPFRGSLFKKEC